MADPHWSGYVGMVTGIAGAVMGFISYRRSNNYKSLELRLELQRSLNDLFKTHSQLDQLITYANQSRLAISSATGSVRSGRMMSWKESIEKDNVCLSELTKKLPNKEESYDQLSPNQLEVKHCRCS